MTLRTKRNSRPLLPHFLRTQSVTSRKTVKSQCSRRGLLGCDAV